MIISKELTNSALSVEIDGMPNSGGYIGLFDRLTEYSYIFSSNYFTFNKVITENISVTDILNTHHIKGHTPLDTLGKLDSIAFNTQKVNSPSTVTKSDTIAKSISTWMGADNLVLYDALYFNLDMSISDSSSVYDEFSYAISTISYLLREDDYFILREDSGKIVRNTLFQGVSEPVSYTDSLYSSTNKYSSSNPSVTSILQKQIANKPGIDAAGIIDYPAVLSIGKIVSTDNLLKTDSVSITTGKANIDSNSLTDNIYLNPNKVTSDTTNTTDSTAKAIIPTSIDNVASAEDENINIGLGFKVLREDSGYVLKEDGSAEFLRENIVDWDAGHWLDPLWSAFSPSGLAATELNWLQTTEALRGIVFPVFWGKLYSSFADLGTVLDQLATINLSVATPKKLALNLVWRTESVTYNENYLLPPTYHIDDANGNTNLIPNTDGYLLRLWKTSLAEDFKVFISNLKAYIDGHANGDLISFITTSQSGVGTPNIPYTTLDPIYGSEVSIHSNQASIWDYIRSIWPSKIVFANLDLPSGAGNFVNTYSSTLLSKKIGLMLNNSNNHYMLTDTLALMQPLSGSIPCAIRVDNADYLSTIGDTSNPNYPSVSTIISQRSPLETNYIIWKGLEYFHDGYNTNQSVLNYLQTNKNVLVFRSQGGGLKYDYPTCHN